MIPFRRILFPVDYSTACEATVSHVKNVARRFEAELTLLHAYGPFDPAYRDLVEDIPLWPPSVKAFEEKRLKRFAAASFGGSHLELEVIEAEPGIAIRDSVERQGADLVMMPTRGQGPLRRLLLGSVTTKVLHDLSTAIWTATAKGLDHQEPPRTILCALDDTEESEAVLKSAMVLASSYQAKLCLVHTLFVPHNALNAGFGLSPQRVLHSAEEKMCELKRRLNVDAPHTIIESSMAEGVLTETLRRKADLLVVGRGRSQHAMDGICSRLYSLIREAPCPLISI